jgi:predicted oxidoreductase
VLGTTRPDRLRSCAKALTVSLTREEWYSLFAAARGAPMP